MDLQKLKAAWGNLSSPYSQGDKARRERKAGLP